jgi:phage gpG-like protein
MAAKRAGSPRNFPGKLSPRIGKRGGVLVQAGKGKNKGKAHYALVKKVTIPARPFVGWSDAAVDAVAKLVLKEMEGRI